MAAFRKHLVQFGLIILGSLMTAFAMDLFLIPNKIAAGGVSGIATVLHYLSGNRLPVGLTMLAMDIPLFLLALRILGARFGLRSLFATFFLSVSIDLMGPVLQPVRDRWLVLADSGKPDLLLCALIGGAIMGAGLGIVVRAGATTGGTDLAARLVVHFKPAYTMGQVLMIIDSMVILSAGIAFESLALGLYAVIALFVCTKTIDTLVEGFNFAKSVTIISGKSGPIATRLMQEMDRGVTGLEGRGMYTGNDKRVLMCVVHRSQIAQLKMIVSEEDAGAFVVVADAREVLGEGFKTYEHPKTSGKK